MFAEVTFSVTVNQRGSAASRGGEHLRSSVQRQQVEVREGVRAGAQARISKWHELVYKVKLARGKSAQELNMHL